MFSLFFFYRAPSFVHGLAVAYRVQVICIRDLRPQNGDNFPPSKQENELRLNKPVAYHSFRKNKDFLNEIYILYLHTNGTYFYGTDGHTQAHS